jgi:hypothetical protein
VNTASVAGLLSGVPYLGPYAVSKVGVVSISETLRIEMRMAGAPIGVSVLCPSATNTSVMEADRNRPAWAGGEQRTPDAEEMRLLIRSGFTGPNGKEPEEIAARVIDAIKKDTFWVITHNDMKPMIERRLDDIRQAIPKDWLSYLFHDPQPVLACALCYTYPTRNAVESVGATRVNVKFTRRTTCYKALRIADALVSKDVQFTDFDVRVGQTREVSCASGRRFSWYFGSADRVTEQRMPTGVIVVVTPSGVRHQERVRCGVAIVEHGIDQDLPGEGNAAITGLQRCGRSETATRAVAHHSDPQRVDR